jgi:integrative and conjugative element protein (TIGR02256 family)
MAKRRGDSTANGEYEVRVSMVAVAEIRAETRRGARVRGGTIETGGTLLGAFDLATGVVWVDEASGPPPDSRLSDVHFEHGIQGVDQLIAARSSATARVSSFVGMWHSHPFGEASPSDTDRSGMRDLVLPVADAPHRALLLIVGGSPGTWQAWLSEGGPPDWYARVVVRGASTAGETRSAPHVVAGTGWWSGGWWSGRPDSRRRRRRRPLRWLRRWKKGAAA